EIADPQPVRSIHHALHARQASARTRDHGAAMTTEDKYVIAKHLKTPIAIVNEHGGVEWRNDAFEATFGADAKEWLTQAARARTALRHPGHAGVRPVAGNLQDGPTPSGFIDGSAA